jgi:hypothetical protein
MRRERDKHPLCGMKIEFAFVGVLLVVGAVSTVATIVGMF